MISFDQLQNRSRTALFVSDDTSRGTRCWRPGGGEETMKQFSHRLEKETLISSDPQRARACVVSFE